VTQLAVCAGAKRLTANLWPPLNYRPSLCTLLIQIKRDAESSNRISKYGAAARRSIDRPRGEAAPSRGGINNDKLR